MPPFREGPIRVDRRLSGVLLKELREVGHGHRINIVDASYDIPRESVVHDFPGDSADAYLSIARVIPIEREDSEGEVDVCAMLPDQHLLDNVVPGIADSRIYIKARSNFKGVGSKLTREIEKVDFTNIEECSRHDGVDYEGSKGFYSLANSQANPHFFVRTIDELPFACISLVVGHSQR
jgi:L-fucose mutarotase/ribose pyranase (RbsD/FucU family)